MPVGGGATPVRNESTAVASTPVRIAAGKRRMESTVISRNPKMASRHGSGRQMARTNRRARKTQSDDAGLIQSDESEKEADADGIAVAECERNRVDHPLAQAEDREQDEDDSRQQHRAQRALPCVSEDVNDRESDEGVLAHVGRNRERTLRIKAHQQRAEDRRQDGGGDRGFQRHAGRS